MRRCRVLRPRSARKLSKGPCTAPTEFCRNAICSASSLLSPTTSMPPTMSEWPLRNLVAECITRSAPCSSGRCRIGEAKVLSTATSRPWRCGDRRDRLQVDDLQHRVGRGLDPEQLAVGPDRSLERAGVGQVDVAEIQAGAAPAHALEQAIAAAVEIVHRDDVAAAVEQVEQGRRGREAGREREPAAAAFEAGDAALVGETGRIVGTRILEALVHARTGLGIGRGRVDRRHHRAGAGIRRLPGVDGLGAQRPMIGPGVALPAFVLHARRSRHSAADSTIRPESAAPY